jgi:Tfp pilus assembly protein PilN
MVRGFGEGTRGDRYRRRLGKVAVLLAVTLVLLLAVIAVATFAKYLEWQRMEALYNEVQQQAGEASSMRSGLLAANKTLAAVDELIRDYPSPHEELARLTAMLEDTTYITQFSMQGNEISLRGISTDAAAVMQLFTGEPAYASVTALGPIRAFSGGLQEFHFRIALAEEVAQ